MVYNLFIVSIAFFLLACSNGKKNSNSHVAVPIAENIALADSNAIKIYVELNGKITADGNEISLTSLDGLLAKLKSRNGIVYYSRANGQGEPPPNAMKVVELVVKNSLPVKLFTDKTFTVIVNNTGRPETP